MAAASMRARTVVDPHPCPDALDELISLADAAEIAGRAPQTVRQAMASGKLDGRNMGGAWVTTRAAVSDWLAYLAVAPWRGRIAEPRRPQPKRRVARRF